MRRLRETWLAFGGSALIIALSVTSALGADPALDAIDNVGQQVSEFAQSLNGQNQDGDEPVAEEQPDLQEDEQLDEGGDGDAFDTEEDTLGDDEEAADEDADAEAEPGDDDFDWTSVSHGFCVSWHAHQDETTEDNAPEGGEEEWANHGEFVSYWATTGCDTEDGDDADADEADEACDEADEDADAEECDDEEEAADEDADAEAEPGDEDFDWTAVSHGFCVSWHAQQDEELEENAPEDEESWKNHGEFVSYWATTGCDTEDGDDADEADEAGEDADTEEDEEEDSEAARAEREAAKAERKAQREAAKAEREAAREAARQNGGQNGNGNGNGRGRGGGGRP